MMTQQTNDYAEKRFEIDFLGKLLSRKSESPSNPGLPIGDLSYEQTNKLNQMIQHGFVIVISLDGEDTAYITNEGIAWLTPFDDAQKNVVLPSNVGMPWSPTSSSMT
jgi:hypothetical protein